jgi:membrane protein implicated in regulation of membrane protease activity
MTSWWGSFFDGGLFYWAIAIFASVVQALLILGSLMGGAFETDHAEIAGEAADGGDSHAGGISIFSVRVLVAFFVGFGWAGVLGHYYGMSKLSTAMSAAIAGLVFMALLFFTLRFLVSMKHDGTLRYANAVGQEGQVYVTIPAARSGPGQVELLLQGRLITASAVTDAPAPLPPRTPVTVTALEPMNLLVVQPTAATPLHEHA